MDKVQPCVKADWVFLGDASRYEFLSWLVPEAKISLLADHPVIVRFGRLFHQEWQDETYWVTAPALLPDITVYLPPEDQAGAWGRQDDIDQAARYAIFEEHPFGKESSEHISTQLKMQGAKVLMVLMDLPYRHASTDLSGTKEDLLRVERRYRENGATFKIIKDADETLSILLWREPMMDHWRRHLEKNLYDLRKRIDEFTFEYHYDYLLDLNQEGGFLSASSIDRLFSFETVKRGPQSSIWKCFSNRANQLLFPKTRHGGLYPIAELYGSCLRDCHLSFLPIEEDQKRLMAKLKQAAEEFFQEKSRPGEKPSPLNEKEYLSLISAANRESLCCGITVDFENALYAFVGNPQSIPKHSKVLTIVKALLELRYSQLKKLLESKEVSL